MTKNRPVLTITQGANDRHAQDFIHQPGDFAAKFSAHFIQRYATFANRTIENCRLQRGAIERQFSKDLGHFKAGLQAAGGRVPQPFGIKLLAQCSLGKFAGMEQGLRIALRHFMALHKVAYPVLKINLIGIILRMLFANFDHAIDLQL
jgi:hypothetical protein